MPEILEAPATAKTGRSKGWSNLKPAKKGDPSRNPSGRPKTHDFRADLLGWLKSKGGSGETIEKEILLSLKETKPEIILYYAYGKPVETINGSISLVAGLPAEVLDGLRKLALATIEEKQAEAIPIEAVSRIAAPEVKPEIAPVLESGPVNQSAP